MTFSWENYLKVMYHLSRGNENPISTNAIAKVMKTKSSSVTDMVKKMADKNLVYYTKYKGTALTKFGEQIAVKTIRKHRLWECFLVDKLHFSWEEVHEVAEQLEHIKSEKLIEELDTFLGYPKKDPHGDPIPDKFGVIPIIKKIKLSHCQVQDKGILIGVEDSSKEFLKYLNKLKLQLGDHISVLNIESFDKSMTLQINGERNLTISALTTNSIYLQKE